MRKMFAILCLLSLLLSLWGCTTALVTSAPLATDSLSATQATPPQTTAPAEPEIAPLFECMPQTDADVAQVFFAGDAAVFVFMISGMDAAQTSIVTYDLVSDEVIAQIDLGEDIYQIFPRDNGFAVLSLYRSIYWEYDLSCNAVVEIPISCAEGGIGMAALSGDTLLLSQIMTGQLLLLHLSDHTVLEVDLPPNIYSVVGAYGDAYLLESYEQGLHRVNMDGSAVQLYYKGSAQIVGGNVAAGIHGDYITFLPLQVGDAIMIPSVLDAEMFIFGNETALLSRSQSLNFADVLHYYAMDSMTCVEIQAGGHVLAAAAREKGIVAVIRKGEDQPLTCVWLPMKDAQWMPITTMAYDSGILNGGQPLPEPTGSERMISLIRRYEEEYGVRVVYEPGIFDVEDFGYELVPCTEDVAYERALLLENLLQFLPQGLFKEMGQQWPVVIYLCESIYPTAGGMQTVVDGYNVMFLSVTGNDAYFLNVAAHEMGHALDIGMSYEVLSGWMALMPQQVQDAYQHRDLTVEYTPDDKGRTPVWFVDVYGRFSEREDRAVLFSHLFNDWLTGEDTVLQYDGLRIKADYWAQMLRMTYTSCADYIFPWENPEN